MGRWCSLLESRSSAPGEVISPRRRPRRSGSSPRCSMKLHSATLMEPYLLVAAEDARAAARAAGELAV